MQLRSCLIISGVSVQRGWDNKINLFVVCKNSIINGMRMRTLFFTLVCMCGCLPARADFVSCGPGYILVESRRKIDGIPTAECQKLWCRDLENGKYMGNENKANSGYQITPYPLEMCDSKDNCVLCWGERKWCAGEVRGDWNPEYGAYTRGGDNATYESYQKGGCFVWRLEKPECDKGETAILENGKWVCAIPSGSVEASRASGVRRTSTTRGIRR